VHDRRKQNYKESGGVRVYVVYKQTQKECKGPTEAMNFVSMETEGV
jgi:hypothetical protein